MQLFNLDLCFLKIRLKIIGLMLFVPTIIAHNRPPVKKPLSQNFGNPAPVPKASKDPFMFRPMLAIPKDLYERLKISSSSFTAPYMSSRTTTETQTERTITSDEARAVIFNSEADFWAQKDNNPQSKPAPTIYTQTERTVSSNEARAEIYNEESKIWAQKDGNPESRQPTTVHLQTERTISSDEARAVIFLQFQNIPQRKKSATDLTKYLSQTEWAIASAEGHGDVIMRSQLVITTTKPINKRAKSGWGTSQPITAVEKATKDYGIKIRTQWRIPNAPNAQRIEKVTTPIETKTTVSDKLQFIAHTEAQNETLAEEVKQTDPIKDVHHTDLVQDVHHTEPVKDVNHANLTEEIKVATISEEVKHADPSKDVNHTSLIEEVNNTTLVKFVINTDLSQGVTNHTSLAEKSNDTSSTEEVEDTVHSEEVTSPAGVLEHTTLDNIVQEPYSMPVNIDTEQFEHNVRNIEPNAFLNITTDPPSPGGVSGWSTDTSNHSLDVALEISNASPVEAFNQLDVTPLAKVADKVLNEESSSDERGAEDGASEENILKRRQGNERKPYDSQIFDSKVHDYNSLNKGENKAFIVFINKTRKENVRQNDSQDSDSDLEDISNLNNTAGLEMDPIFFKPYAKEINRPDVEEEEYDPVKFGSRFPLYLDDYKYKPYKTRIKIVCDPIFLRSARSVILWPPGSPFNVNRIRIKFIQTLFVRTGILNFESVPNVCMMFEKSIEVYFNNSFDKTCDKECEMYRSQINETEKEIFIWWKGPLIFIANKNLELLAVMVNRYNDTFSRIGFGHNPSDRNIVTYIEWTKKVHAVKDIVNIKRNWPLPLMEEH